MIAKYSNQIARHFARTRQIDEEDIDIYAYGFELLISMIASILLSLAMSIVFRRFYEALILLVIYCHIRKYAGGYHADSHLNCLVSFQAVIFSMLWISTHIYGDLDFLGCVLILIVCNAMLFWLAPVESPEIPLTPTENSRNKKATMIVSCIYSFILLTAFVTAHVHKVYVASGIMAIVMVSGVVVAGYIKNTYRKRW